MFKETWENEDGVVETKVQRKADMENHNGHSQGEISISQSPEPAVLDSSAAYNSNNAYSTWAMCNAGVEILDVFFR
ncbi:hypothetical protein OS493_012756 [Desmophyllum pertusum]|uniref:Uncharacterized protein n=1 Tax=Desmophyllum pertusum TaxID=174260 RepID=A0A9X0D067_9CNID|nr:hypothetical protein OS493_012756 [Desmophyllum pertusum]